MNPDHVSREASLQGRDLFAENSSLSNYGDLQFGGANNHYDPSLWASDHGADELAFSSANHQPHSLQGWNTTIPPPVNPTPSGYPRPQSYATQTSSPYPGQNFSFNNQIGYSEPQLDPGLAAGAAPNTYNLGPSSYRGNTNHSSTISPQALQQNTVPEVIKSVSLFIKSLKL